MEPTEDLTCFITERGDDYVQYENTDGLRWRIHGQCTACGACEVYTGHAVAVLPVLRKTINGALLETTRTLRWSAPPGTPGACREDGYENRLDIPMTPDAVAAAPGCAMRGEWL